MATRAAGAQPSSRDVGPWVAFMGTPAGALTPLLPDGAAGSDTSYVVARVARWRFPGASTNLIHGVSLHRRRKASATTATFAVFNPGCDCPLVTMVGFDNTDTRSHEFRDGAVTGAMGFRTSLGYGYDSETHHFSVSVGVPIALSYNFPRVAAEAFVTPSAGFGDVNGARPSGGGMARVIGGGFGLSSPKGHRLVIGANRVLVERSATSIGVSLAWRL